MEEPMQSLGEQWDDFKKNYEEKTGVRTLLQLLPYGGNVDTVLAGKANQLKKARARAFFDALHQVGPITDEMIDSNDFLHAYFKTFDAAVRTARDSKIMLFAQLFSTYVACGQFDQVDDYEETLRILDDLSAREFQVLMILHKFEAEHPPQAGKNQLQRCSTFWQDFLDEVVATFQIDEAQIAGMLTRLNRTGLYQTIVGMYFDYEGDKGHLTPSFDLLLAALGRGTNAETVVSSGPLGR